MCGICNVVRCITGGNRRCESGYDRRAYWQEPCMKTHCASGIGTRSSYPCSEAETSCRCRQRNTCCGETRRDYSCYETRKNCCDSEW